MHGWMDGWKHGWIISLYLLFGVSLEVVNINARNKTCKSINGTPNE